jgi:hypothetical protein
MTSEKNMSDQPSNNPLPNQEKPAIKPKTELEKASERDAKLKKKLEELRKHDPHVYPTF